MATSSKDQGVDTRRYRHTLRLRFEFDGESLELISRVRVAMIAPGSPARRPKVGEDGGLWVEVLGDDKHVLFHRVLSNPLRARVEVHSPDRKHEMLHGDPQPGTFEVLIPDIPGARQVAVFGTPLTADRAKESGGRSEELGRFDLAGDDGKAQD